MKAEEIALLFENAILHKDADLADEAVTQAFLYEKPAVFEKFLNAMLSADWHREHEDIARLLQQIASPDSVVFLAEAATLKFAYLDYDDSKAFARKCTWALADIGTEAAKKALEKLAANEDLEIAGFAQKRLDNWQNEQHRKKNSEAEKREFPKQTVYSEFTLRATSTGILGVVSLIGIFIFGTNVLAKPWSKVHAGDFYVLALLLFSCVYLILGELRTKALKIAIHGNIVEKKAFLGFGRKVTYDLSDFDGFQTCDIATKNVVHEYLYLMKGDRKVVKISQAYHSNYRALKEAIVSGMPNKGHIRFWFWDEVTEVFSK